MAIRSSSPLSLRREAALLGAACVAALSLNSSPKAQGSLHMLVGFAGDNTNQKNSVPMAGMYDVDRDGKIASGDDQELFGFMRKVFSVNGGKGGFISDCRHQVENGELAYYVADAGDGYVLRAVDANGNGLIDATEVSSYAKFGVSSTFGPNTIAVTKQAGKTVLYTAWNDYKGRYVRGIYRSVDANNDGDALDAGETVSFINKNSKLVFPGKGTTKVTISLDHWDCLRSVSAIGPGGRKTNLLAWRGLADQGNGAFASVPADSWAWLGLQESAGKITKQWVFFNPSKKNGYVVNADVLSGALVDTDTVGVVATVKKYYNGNRFLEVDPTGGAARNPVYYIANANGPTPPRTFGSKNGAGKFVHGVIFRAEDKNLDGDIQDKGEVRIFFNGSGNTLPGGAGNVAPPTWTDPIKGKVSDLSGSISGLSFAGGRVYIQVYQGTANSIFELNDKNKNGLIETGEVKIILQVTSPYPKVWSAQYGPYTINLHGVDANLVVDPMATGVAPFGAGCVGTNGLMPRSSAFGGSPKVGGLKTFGISLKRARPNMASFFFLGFSKTKFGTIPLPLPLDGLGMKGCKQLVSPDVIFAAVNSANGTQRLPFPIPNDASLKGLRFYTQWWTQDQGANAANLTASSALDITIQ